MDVVTTSLEALIQRATNPLLNQPESAAFEAFWSVMVNSADGVLIATRVIAARVQSQNAAEALLALSMLDKCMRRGDPTFRSEVGKFRFLNEMIKLVSPKYYGNRTVPAVRQKVLQLLYMWTIDYPNETKIKDAFEMLKKQGVVKETPQLPPTEVPANCPRSKSATFEDEEKSKLLQKLLQSKNPDDLQAANRLIKTMVKEEERRSMTALQEARAAREGARLLGDVVGAWEAAGGDGAPAQHRQLAAELRETCKRLRAPLVNSCRANLPPDILGEILDANDELAQAFQRYDELIRNIPPEARHPSDSLVKFEVEKTHSDDSSPRKSSDGRKAGSAIIASPLDDLGEIFSSISPPADESGSILLKPVTLVPSLSKSTNGVVSPEQPSSSKQSSNGLAALDALGKDLLKQSLAESKLEDSLKKVDKKVPMNAMDLAGISTQNALSGANNNILDLDFLVNRTNAQVAELTNANDDVMVDLNMDDNILKTDPSDDTEVCQCSEITNGMFSRKNSEDKCEGREFEIKTCGKSSLVDINLSLDSVQPSSLTPLTIFEEEKGLTVVLHFVKDRPREDVAVYVVTTTSKNPQPIDEYKFHTVVPKGYKSRLLEPSDTKFPSFKPFIPPASITQLLLISAPSPDITSMNMHFLITYINNGDAISEMGHVDALPLVGD